MSNETQLLQYMTTSSGKTGTARRASLTLTVMLLLLLFGGMGSKALAESYTYIVINHSGEQAIKETVTETSGQAPDITRTTKIASPLVTKWFYYSDEECTTTMSTLPASDATVYVRYSHNYNRELFNLNRNVAYQIMYGDYYFSNNGNNKDLRFFQASETVLTSTPGYASWTFDGNDPYRIQLFNYATTNAYPFLHATGTDAHMYPGQTPGDTDTKFFTILNSPTRSGKYIVAAVCVPSGKYKALRKNGQYAWGRVEDAVSSINNDDCCFTIVNNAAIAPSLHNYTYYVVNKSGEVTVWNFCQQSAGTAPHIPDIIHTPLLADNAFHYYTYSDSYRTADKGVTYGVWSDRAKWNTYSNNNDAVPYGKYTIPSGTAELTTLPAANTKILVTYDANATIQEVNGLTIDLSGGTAYNIKLHDGYLYAPTTSTVDRNRSAIADATLATTPYLWSLGGNDPYNIQLRNESVGSDRQLAANETDNGQTEDAQSKTSSFSFPLSSDVNRTSASSYPYNAYILMQGDDGKFELMSTYQKGMSSKTGSDNFAYAYSYTYLGTLNQGSDLKLRGVFTRPNPLATNANAIADNTNSTLKFAHGGVYIQALFSPSLSNCDYNFKLVRNGAVESTVTVADQPAGGSIASILPTGIQDANASGYLFYPTLADALAGTNAITALPYDKSLNVDIFVVRTYAAVSVTYRIINKSGKQFLGDITGTFTPDDTPEENLPNAYQSPLATNYRFYTDGNYNSTINTYSPTGLIDQTSTPYSPTADDVIYVMADYNPSNSVTFGSNTFHVDLTGQTQYAINMDTEGSPRYLYYASAPSETTKNGLSYYNIPRLDGAAAQATPSTWTSNYLWRFESIGGEPDPYGILIRHANFPNHFLSSTNGNGRTSDKGTNWGLWSDDGLNDSYVKFWALLNNNKLVSELFTDATYKNMVYYHDTGWLRWDLNYTNIATNTSSIVYLISPNVVTYHVVNKSNAIAISKMVTPASGDMAMPSELKTPYITSDANYKFFSTQADAYAYSSAANETARDTAATKAISGAVQAGQIIYVGYYYDPGQKPEDLPSLDGSIYYQIQISNGNSATKNYLYTSRKQTGNTSDNIRFGDEDATDSYSLWAFWNNDPYNISITNKFLTETIKASAQGHYWNAGFLLNNSFSTKSFVILNDNTSGYYSIACAWIENLGSRDYLSFVWGQNGLQTGSVATSGTNYGTAKIGQNDGSAVVYYSDRTAHSFQFIPVAMGNFRFVLHKKMTGGTIEVDTEADYSSTSKLITLPDQLVRRFASSDGKYYTTYSGGAFSGNYNNYKDMWDHGTHSNLGADDDYVTIHVDYTTSMPFSTSTDYEHATWYQFKNVGWRHYLGDDNFIKASDTDSYSTAYQFAFWGDPYEIRIWNRKKNDPNSFVGVPAGSTGNTLARMVSASDICTWELVKPVESGYTDNQFILRQYGNYTYMDDVTERNKSYYLGFPGGTRPLAFGHTAWVRHELVPLPANTYTFNVVDNTGRIAIKYTLKSDEKLEPTSLLANNYTAIPAAIRSPYLENETITFYATATQRVDGESTPVYDADGRAVYDLTDVLTETPATDGANIYVRYTTGDLSNKPLHLGGARGFLMQVNGKYAIDEGGALKQSATSDDNNRSHQWYLLGGDPYAVQVRNVETDTRYFTHDTSEGTVTLGNTGANTYFILMKNETSDGTSAGDPVVELMAATGADLGSTDYYSVGRTTGENDPALFASSSAVHGDAKLRIQLTVAHLEVGYRIIDLQKKIVVQTEKTNSTVLGLPSEWKSPLVPADGYHYWHAGNFNVTGFGTNAIYTLKEAQSEVIGTSAATDGYIYVTYDVITDKADANYVDMNPKVTDITNRVERSATDKSKVRDAGKFGTMYRLEFLNGVDDYLEDADAVLTSKKKPIYPYTNGDGAMYVYGSDKWESDIKGGSSTRTRWTWYILSPNQDPYHVMVTSWQNSHSRGGVNYYNFLRTYYNTTIDQVVTNVVSDDPIVTAGDENSDPEAVPSEYMLLGTKSAYKLVTSKEVNGDHQTVNTLEHYWKTWETVSLKDQYTPPETINPNLKDVHTYGAWVNARPDVGGGNREFKYRTHYYHTMNMGSTFDLVATEIDAVLVLLDNHGWEVMRHNIAKSSEPEKKAIDQAALRKYDSPMVKQYKFYGTRNVTHKVAGYHKYSIIDNYAGTDGKALKHSDLLGTAASLADYPEKYSGGSIYDLYVTYDVKPEYADAYTGSETGGTANYPFLIRQDGKLAKANSATELSSTEVSGTGIDTNGPLVGVDESTNADLYWYLKPNFDIDTEMGYLYDVTEKDGANNDVVISQETTNQRYHTNGLDGFDPYNIQIYNKRYATSYLTTNALGAVVSENQLTATAYDGDAKLSLGGTPSEKFTATITDYDSKTLHVTNATFMAVQDANGNMRLMPRFDHSRVAANCSVLETPEGAKPVEDKAFKQTTILLRPEVYTYIIIDNEGHDALHYKSVSTGSPSTPVKFVSPLAKNFRYYKNLTATAGVYPVTGIDENEITGSFHASIQEGDITANTIYVRYEYSPTADADGLLKGTWYNAKLDGQDVKVTTGGIAQETFTNDAEHRWRFMENAADDADPYSVKLWNGKSPAETEASGNRYIVLKHSNGDYALMQANGSETYKFLDGSSTSAVLTTQGDYAINGTLPDHTHLTLSSVLATNNVIFKVITNTGHVALTSGTISVTADSKLRSIMPEWMKTPLMKSDAYKFYSGAKDMGDGTFQISGDTTSTPKTLDANVVYVRYTYNTSKVATSLNSASSATQLDLSGKVPFLIANNGYYWMRPNGEGKVPLKTASGISRNSISHNLWYFTGNDPYEIKISNRDLGGDQYLSIDEVTDNVLTNSDHHYAIMTPDGDTTYTNNTFMILTSGDRNNLAFYVTGSQRLTLCEFFSFVQAYQDTEDYSTRWTNRVNARPSGGQTSVSNMTFIPAAIYHIITNSGEEAISAGSTYGDVSIGVPFPIQSPLLKEEAYSYYSSKPTADNVALAKGTTLSTTANALIGDIYVRYSYSREDCAIMYSDGLDKTTKQGLDLSGNTWYNLGGYSGYNSTTKVVYYNYLAYTSENSIKRTTITGENGQDTSPRLSDKSMLWRFENDDPYAIKIVNCSNNKFVSGNRGSSTVTFSSTEDSPDFSTFMLLRGRGHNEGNSGISAENTGIFFVPTGLVSDNRYLCSSANLFSYTARTDLLLDLGYGNNAAGDLNWGWSYFYKAPVTRKYHYHAIKFDSEGNKIGPTWDVILEHDWLTPVVLEDQIARLYAKYEQYGTEGIFKTRETLSGELVNDTYDARFYHDEQLLTPVHDNTYGDDIYPEIDTEEVYDIYFKYQVDNTQLDTLVSSPSDIAADVTTYEADGRLSRETKQAKWFFMVLDTDFNVTTTGTAPDRSSVGKQYFLRREDDGTVGWMNNDYSLHKEREDNYNNWTYHRLAEWYKKGDNDAFREGRWLWAFVGNDPYNMRIVNMETAIGVTPEAEGVYSLEAAENCYTTIAQKAHETKDKDNNVTISYSYPVVIPTAEPTENHLWGLCRGNNAEQTMSLLSTAIQTQREGINVNLPLYWQMQTTESNDSVAGTSRATDRSNSIRLLPYIPVLYEDVNLVIRRKDEVATFNTWHSANPSATDAQIQAKLADMKTGISKLYFAASDRMYEAGDEVDMSREDALPLNVRRAFCDYTLFSDVFQTVGGKYRITAGPYPAKNKPRKDEFGFDAYDEDGKQLFYYYNVDAEGNAIKDGAGDTIFVETAQSIYASYEVTSDVFLAEHPTEAQVRAMAESNDHVFFMDFPHLKEGQTEAYNTGHHAYYHPSATFRDQTGDLTQKRDKETGVWRTEKKIWDGTKFIDDTTMPYNHCQFKTTTNRMESVPENLKWYFVGDPYHAQVYCTAGPWGSNNGYTESTPADAWSRKHDKPEATVAANLCRFDETETNFQFVVDCVHLRIPDYGNIDTAERVNKHNENGTVKMEEDADGNLVPVTVHNRGVHQPYFNDFYWEVVPAASNLPGAFALRFKEDNDLLGYRNVYYYLGHDGLNKLYRSEGEPTNYFINLSYRPDNERQERGDFKGYHKANNDTTIIRLMQPAKVYVSAYKADNLSTPSYPDENRITQDELSEYYGVGEVISEMPRHLQRKYVKYGSLTNAYNDVTAAKVTLTDETSTTDAGSIYQDVTVCEPTTEHSTTVGRLTGYTDKLTKNAIYKFKVDYIVDDLTNDADGKQVHLFTTPANYASGSLQWLDMMVGSNNWLYYDKTNKDGSGAENQTSLVSNYCRATSDNKQGWNSKADGWNDGLKGLHWAFVGDPYDFTIVNRRRYEDGTYGTDDMWLVVNKQEAINNYADVADSIIWTTTMKPDSTMLPAATVATSAATAVTATQNTHFSLQMWKVSPQNYDNDYLPGNNDDNYFLRTASLKVGEDDTNNSSGTNQTNNYWRMVSKSFGGTAPNFASYFEMVPFQLSDLASYTNDQTKTNYSKTMNGLGELQQKLVIRTAVAKDDDQADNDCFDANVEVRSELGELRVQQDNMEVRYGYITPSLPNSLRRYGCDYRCYLNYGDAENEIEITKFRETETDYDTKQEPDITAEKAKAQYDALQAAMAAAKAEGKQVKLTYVYSVNEDASAYFTTESDAKTEEYTWMNTYFKWTQYYTGTNQEIIVPERQFDHYVYNSAGEIEDEVWITVPKTILNPDSKTPYYPEGYLNSHTGQNTIYGDEGIQSSDDRQKWSLVGDPYNFTMTNYAQYLKNQNSAIDMDGSQLSASNIESQRFAILLDRDGATAYLAQIDDDPTSPTYGQVTHLITFDHSSNSDKSVMAVGKGVDTNDPTGNTFNTVYKNLKNEDESVKPFYLTGLIKYADILQYHLVIAHQHSLDPDEDYLKNLFADFEGTDKEKANRKVLRDHLTEYLKYWGIRRQQQKNDSTYYLTYDARGVANGLATTKMSSIDSLLKKKASLRDFITYPVEDQIVSRIGIGNRPAVPWYMKRQFCTYYMYQRDVQRSVVNSDSPAYEVADNEWIEAGKSYYEIDGVKYKVDTSSPYCLGEEHHNIVQKTFVENGTTKKAYNVKWVSLFDVSSWSDWDNKNDSETKGDIKYTVTSDDVTRWGNGLIAGNYKKQPSGVEQARSLNGGILDKLYDCHLNRKVIIDVVYEVNPNNFRFADRGRNTTAWYQMMTNNENDGLMNFSYLHSIGARLDRTHHYTNNYLWAPEGDPYGFVLRSRYATINGTGWDDVAVTTKGKLPKGKVDGVEKYIDGSGTVTDFTVTAETESKPYPTGYVPMYQATYTGSANSYSDIPFSNKRIIHRRTGDKIDIDGGDTDDNKATSDGATNAVYEMFVGMNDKSFLMHPTSAWMDNDQADHESYYMTHNTTNNTTVLDKKAYKELQRNEDANWRLLCTSEQLIPYFNRSGFVGGLDPVKAQTFTNQGYYAQLQQSIENGEELSFSTLQKIQELVYSGTFLDNEGKEVAEGADRPAASKLPMTFKSDNLLNMEPGYYRIKAFSEDALNTDGRDLSGTKIKGIIGPRYISGYRFKSEMIDNPEKGTQGGRWLHFLETSEESSTIHTYDGLRTIIDDVNTEYKKTHADTPHERDIFEHKAMRGNIEILPAEYDPSTIFYFTEVPASKNEGQKYTRYAISTQGLQLRARPGGTQTTPGTIDADCGHTMLEDSTTQPKTNYDYRFRLIDVGGTAVTLRTIKTKVTTSWDDVVAENLKTNYLCIDSVHRYRITSHKNNEMKEIGDHYTTDGLNGIQDTKWLLQPVGARTDWPYNEMPLRVEVHQGGVKDQNLTGSELTSADNRDPYCYGTIYLPFDARLNSTIDAAFTLTHAIATDATETTMHSVSQHNNMGNPQFIPAGWPVVVRTNQPKGGTKNSETGEWTANTLPDGTQGRLYVELFLPNKKPTTIEQPGNVLQGEYLEQELVDDDIAKQPSTNAAATDKRVMVFGLPFTDHSGHSYNEQKHVGWYTNENWWREADNAYDATARTANDTQRNNKYVYHNKAYLFYTPVPASSRRHVVALFDDEERPDQPLLEQGVTGNDVPWPCDVYDLQGRRVAENETPQTLRRNHPALSKGVYVFGGRKVIVK